MSNHHLVLVRKIKNLKGPARAVLIVLADRADDNGNCYPGMAKISKESGFCRSTVKTALRSLKDDGWISWKQRHNDDGDLSSNLYTLDLGRAEDDLPRAGDDPEVGQELPGGRAGAGHKASSKAPDGSINEASLFPGEKLPMDESASTKKKHLQELAESIYLEYPRKEAKKPGLVAILKAMRSNDPAVLLEKTKSYSEAIGWQERRYIPLPATWFNEERFNDDPEAWKQPTGNTTTQTKPKEFTANDCSI